MGLRYRDGDESEIRVQPLIVKLEVTRQSLAVVGSFGRLHCAVPVAVVILCNESAITPKVITTRYLILLANKAHG